MKKEFECFYEATFKKNLNRIRFEYNMRYPEDALQEAYINFYNKYYPNWDSTKSGLETYFINYLNMCLNSAFNKDKKQNIISLDSEIDLHDGGNSNSTLHDILADEQPEEDNSVSKIEDINKIIDKSSDKIKGYYKILILYNDGMLYKDIAEMLGVNIHSLKSNIKYLRKYISVEYNKMHNTNKSFKKIKDVNLYKKSYRKKKLIKL